MAFFPPIPLIRKNHIIKKLTENNAFSEETAKTFSEAGIINPNGFNKINERLIKQKVLVKTKDNKYYLNKWKWLEYFDILFAIWIFYEHSQTSTSV